MCLPEPAITENWRECSVKKNRMGKLGCQEPAPNHRLRPLLLLQEPRVNMFIIQTYHFKLEQHQLKSITFYYHKACNANPGRSSAVLFNPHAWLLSSWTVVLRKSRRYFPAKEPPSARCKTQLITSCQLHSWRTGDAPTYYPK